VILACPPSARRSYETRKETPPGSSAPLTPPAAATVGVWGSCPSCAGAVPPGVRVCPECAADGAVGAGEIRTAPLATRHRLLAMRVLRVIALVAGVSVVVWAMVTPVLSGPPNVSDPLTTHGLYAIAPGASTVLSGNITGGDAVVGNFTTVNPSGTSLDIAVYNSTEWAALEDGQPATPAWSLTPTATGRIVFSPLYTDLFYFDFTNPYPVSSGINITAYIATEYESNVAAGGFVPS
jgi:hypothetical protein